MFPAPCQTPAAAACALASGAVRFTFGAGLAGFGVTTDRTVADSLFAPVSIDSTVPAVTPVVEASRIALAPAGAATWTVVATGYMVAAASRW